MDKLKPCPFCGGKVSVTYNSCSKSYNFWHKSKNCAAVEPIRFDGCKLKSLNEAIDAWNRRATDGN